MQKKIATLFDDFSFECKRTKNINKERVFDFDTSIVAVCNEVFEKLENL